MKKRILSLLLAVSIACSMLVVPANAAASNAAVQTAVTLGGTDRKDVFITTSKEVADVSGAGAVWHMRAEVPGQPTREYAG